MNEAENFKNSEKPHPEASEGPESAPESAPKSAPEAVVQPVELTPDELGTRELGTHELGVEDAHENRLDLAYHVDMGFYHGILGRREVGILMLLNARANAAKHELVFNSCL